MNHKEIENMIKAFALVVSKDKTRQTLSLAHVVPKEDGMVTIVATDGHIIMVQNNVPWRSLVEYYKIQFSSVIPDEPSEGALNVCPKQKKVNKMPFFFTDEEPLSGNFLPYPKWENTIPRSFENNFISMPAFSSELMVTVQKIFTLYGKKRFNGPDFWNGHRGVALSIVTKNCMLGLMPIIKTFLPKKDGFAVENFNPHNFEEEFYSIEDSDEYNRDYLQKIEEGEIYDKMHRVVERNNGKDV